MSLAWRSMLVLIGCCFSAACSEAQRTPATQFIVAITSDLTPVTELARVRLTVRKRDGGAAASMRDLRVVSEANKADEYALPITFSIGMGTQQSFLLEVSGYGPDAAEASVEYRTIATFEPGKTLLLQVFLGSACVRKVCDDDAICDPLRSSEHSAGSCVAIPKLDRSNARVVTPDRLPDLSMTPPGAIETDAGLTTDAAMSGDAAKPMTCATLASTCDAHAKCDPDGPRCVCDSGYNGDGMRCAAIDACKTDHGGCHEHATCTSTGPGTNSCRCDAGYSGTGQLCQPSNACANANGGCDQNADCTPMGLTDTLCSCKAGYAGNGKQCTAIDACATNHGGCNAVLPCVSTGPGTRECVTAIQVATGDNFTCVLLSDHTARCWGQNQLGQLGNSAVPAQSLTPLPVTDAAGATLKKISTLAVGTYSACAVADGSLLCWGDNAAGQLGDGTKQRHNVPTPSLQTGVTQLTLAHDHTCARTNAGQIACWGANPYGQLGNGSMTESTTPVIAIGSGASLVSASVSNSCAITGNDLLCWGTNYYGQLADGSTTDYLQPHKSLVAGATALAVAPSFGCAVVGGGALDCWGRNNSGQLGIGNTMDHLSPIRVIASGAASACATIAEDELEHACAVLQSGELRCWGNNQHGQLGDGSQVYRDTPVTALNSGARQVACGPRHTCAVMDDGTVRCWGSNGDAATAGSNTQSPVNLDPH